MKHDSFSDEVNKEIRVEYLTYLNPGFVEHGANTISKEDHTSMLPIVLGVVGVIWVYATHEKETVKETAILCQASWGSSNTWE